MKILKKYKFLLFSLLLGFFFIPKDVFAQVTNIKYYDSNFNLLATTSNNNYGQYYTDNVRYIRVSFDDKFEPNTSYITSFDFTLNSPRDYLWVYWNGNSGINAGGSYRITSPTSARTISQTFYNGIYYKRSFLTFEFQNTTGTTSNFFQLDLGSPQLVETFQLINYTISSTSDANTDAIINGFNNLESSMAQNNQSIIDNQNKNHDESEKTRKGIWETIKALPNQFLNMLKGLFIPDDMSFLENFRDSLVDKLGFIAEVPLSVLDFILSLLTASWEEFNSITLPTIDIFGYNFWNSQEISLQPAIDIFEPYLWVTDILCVVLCVNTLRKWYEGFAAGGGHQ